MEVRQNLLSGFAVRQGGMNRSLGIAFYRNPMPLLGAVGVDGSQSTSAPSQRHRPTTITRPRWYAYPAGNLSPVSVEPCCVLHWVVCTTLSPLILLSYRTLRVARPEVRNEGVGEVVCENTLFKYPKFVSRCPSCCPRVALRPRSQKKYVLGCQTSADMLICAKSTSVCLIHHMAKL